MASSFIRILTAALLPIAATMQASGAQTAAVPDDVVIKLERTACFGECPVYTVTIDARGNVNYDGAKFVRVEGRQTDRIAVSGVAAILATAERIGFFGLRDQYRFIQNPDGTSTSVTDQPTTFVTITRNGQSKKVEDYIGAPDGLKQLERQIDEAARTRRWIFLDGQTLEQLVRDGWRPTLEERAELLRKALGEDDVAVVKGLIELGADPNRLYFGTNTPPLMMVRSADAARLLIEAGANPNVTNDNGFTPLGLSADLAPGVAGVLLKAGARVDQLLDSGGTPLWYAACGGNAGVVSLLLSAGADPSVRGALGKSALECAKETRDAERLYTPSPLDGKPPYVKDFDRVIMMLEQALAKRSR
jgi:hypothetical protein